MPVITLTPSLLQAASFQLAQHVVDACVRPDVVIGILNGGAQVSRIMLKALPQGFEYCEVSISRPSTQHKRQSVAHRLLKHLPLAVCDLLRIVESRVTEWRGSKSKLQRDGDIVLTPQVEARLMNAPTSQVLIVDDAIDSGATIQKVRDQLLARYPQLEVKVAAITVTTPHPLCDADFSLYHNRTLCRFPWSNDYRI